MAKTKYKPHDNPCALCGHCEQSKAASCGLCTLCLQLIERSNHIEFVTWDAISQRRIALFPFTSENIMRAGWRNGDGTTGVLVVQFRGSGTAIRYLNVTRQWWQAFTQAESKGSFFHQTVRADPAAYPFTKIN